MTSIGTQNYMDYMAKWTTAHKSLVNNDYLNMNSGKDVKSMLEEGLQKAYQKLKVCDLDNNMHYGYIGLGEFTNGLGHGSRTVANAIDVNKNDGISSMEFLAWSLFQDTNLDGHTSQKELNQAYHKIKTDEGKAEFKTWYNALVDIKNS